MIAEFEEPCGCLVRRLADGPVERRACVEHTVIPVATEQLLLDLLEDAVVDGWMHVAWPTTP